MHKLERLGLALVAVCAVGATLAAAASANQWHSTVANTTWQRTASETQEFEYEFAGKTVACTSLDGIATTTAQTITELTVSPTYLGFELSEVINDKAEVSMNGCEYLFTLQATQNRGPVHIKCPAKNQITVTVKVFGISICTFHIPDQTPAGNISWANEGAAQVNLCFGQSKISATRKAAWNAERPLPKPEP